MTKLKALIALEDGTVFEGESFTGPGEASGELVFNTAMTGYQEILTDPSYHGQIVTLTYPLIGNYGVNRDDAESYQPHAAGLVIGECSRIHSNWRSTGSLPDYLKEHGILGIHQVDTRAITFHIRSKGAMQCLMSTQEVDPQRLVERARQLPSLVGRDLATEVANPDLTEWPGATEPALTVAALDCGIKYNQLRILTELGCRVRIFPGNASGADIAAEKPDGFFISNGPGDPEGAAQAIEIVRTLIHSGTPVFGICFGHQLIGLALGGKTFKMKFGHRGANHPVMELDRRKVEIASQNHGFCVDPDSLPAEVEITHLNLNDNTCAGLRHKQLPVFSVQYHPEAAPGPHDSQYLFNRFVDQMRDHRKARRS
ncbi:MAG: glutamine-hydrolyzing carbamoyl-phosphate synthase small subunit [Verrucomicrobia bacterium]|nr:glutamine-hydrolyzing carbamoyl-phosphate synthase small subunit [Verrucomicrobiota bacterium]